MIVNVLVFGWMILYNHLIITPKQVFDITHFAPVWAAIRQGYTGMIPASSITYYHQQDSALEWDAEHPAVFTP